MTWQQCNPLAGLFVKKWKVESLFSMDTIVVIWPTRVTNVRKKSENEILPWYNYEGIVPEANVVRNHQRHDSNWCTQANVRLIRSDESVAERIIVFIVYSCVFGRRREGLSTQEYLFIAFCGCVRPDFALFLIMGINIKYWCPEWWIFNTNDPFSDKKSTRDYFIGGLYLLYYLPCFVKPYYPINDWILSTTQ